MGKLFLVATPIGNLKDISHRCAETILNSDIILCEDTRHFGILYHELNVKFPNIKAKTVKPKIISYYDQVEDQKIPEIINYLLSNQHVSLVSDAGTPLISDPGYKLIVQAIKKNIEIIAIPGPSAFLNSLITSGMPTDKFIFLGYLPEKNQKRLDLIQKLKQIDAINKFTFITYCAPHKFVRTLSDIKQVAGDIQISVCREITKMHEQKWYGLVSQAIVEFNNPKGEFVIIFRF